MSSYISSHPAARICARPRETRDATRFARARRSANSRSSRRVARPGRAPSATSAAKNAAAGTTRHDGGNMHADARATYPTRANARTSFDVNARLATTWMRNEPTAATSNAASSPDASRERFESSQRSRAYVAVAGATLAHVNAASTMRASRDDATRASRDDDGRRDPRRARRRRSDRAGGENATFDRHARAVDRCLTNSRQ